MTEDVREPALSEAKGQKSEVAGERARRTVGWLIPDRRWFIVAAALGLMAPATLLWPGFALVLVAADVLWVVILGVDAGRVLRVRWSAVDVRRESPAAFSVGRSLPVTLLWRNTGSQTLVLRVREEVSPVVTIAGPAERAIQLPPGSTVREELQVRPLRRGKGEAGLLHVRMRGTLGLV